MKTDAYFDKDAFLTGFLWGLFFSVLAFIFYLSFYKEFYFDEFESLHASWKIFSGERIYIDFFEHHHPLFYYLLVPVMAIWKESVLTLIAARAFVFLMLLLIFIVTYKIAIIVFEEKSAVISLVLLATTTFFVPKAIEIRPDVPQTLFELLSILFLFQYYQNKSLIRLGLSALSLGAAFLFLQKAVVLVLIMGVVLTIDVLKRNIKLRILLLYGAVFLGSLLPYALYLLEHGYMHSYIICNWTYNINFPYYRAGPTILQSCEDNPLLWTFGILNIFFFLKTPNQKRMGIIAAISIAYLLDKNVIAYNQDFMPMIPLIAIMAGAALYLIFRKNTVIIGALLVLSLCCPVYQCLKLRGNAPQLDKIKYILSITTPDDFVFDGNLMGNIFRKDLGFFWTLPQSRRYQKSANYHFDLNELIDKYHPALVAFHHINDINGIRGMDSYYRSDKYNDLFIRKTQCLLYPEKSPGAT